MTTSSDMDRIERDLAATRASIDDRLKTLGSRLLPKQMVNDAFAYCCGGEGADFTKNLVARARAKPLPVVLIGVGVAWLMAPDGKPAAATRAGGVAIGRRGLSPAVGDVFDRSGDAVAPRSVFLEEGNRKMARSDRSAFSTVAGSPFALGALAAVIGVVVGALLPRSAEEGAALGPVATKLRAGGRDLAQDIVDRGGRIAEDTLQAAKANADTNGLSADKPVGELLADVRSGALLDSVKQTAQQTLQAGKDSAQTHLAGASESEPGPRQG